MIQDFSGHSWRFGLSHPQDSIWGSDCSSAPHRPCWCSCVDTDLMAKSWATFHFCWNCCMCSSCLDLERDLSWSWRRGYQWVQVRHLLPSEAASLVWNNKSTSVSPYLCFIFFSCFILQPDWNAALWLILKCVIYHATSVTFGRMRSVLRVKYLPMRLWNVERWWWLRSRTVD